MNVQALAPKSKLKGSRELELHVSGQRQGRNILKEFSFNFYVLDFLS